MTGTRSRFNIPIATWDAAAVELRDLLEVVAERRETVTYGAAVAQVRTISLPPDSSAFHHMLGEISERTFDEGAPLLSTVVVNKHDGKPGGGFARLARRLGFEVADDSDAEDAFWVEQLTAVHEWWGRRPLGKDASDDGRPPASHARIRRSAADVSAGGCRAAVLDAFLRLEGRDGRTTFSPGEVVQEVRQVTSAFKVSTIQTYVVSAMCADAPIHHANHTNDLRRVGRGRYRRAVDWQGNSAPVPAASTHAPVRATAPAVPDRPSSDRLVRSSGADRHAHWAWEGNVQAVAAGALARAGWQLRSLADTASRAQGVDIVADRAGHRLLVEVKGYPAGSSNANTQARHLFGDALLAGVLMAEGDQEASCLLAFPAFTTYTNLVARSRSALERLAIGVLLVAEDGGVTESIPPGGSPVLDDEHNGSN